MFVIISSFRGTKGRKWRLSCFACYNGYDNTLCYTDNGVSGETLKRPAMNRLIADIKLGMIYVVIAVNINRIARGVMPLTEWFQLLDQCGVHSILLGDIGKFDFVDFNNLPDITGCS